MFSLNSSIYGRPIKKYLQSALGPTMAGWVSIVARIVGLAVVMPIAFRTLTPEDTVLWLFFMSAVNFQAIMDFGHNATFGRFIAYARAENKCIMAAADIRLDTLIEIIGPAYARMIFCMAIFIAPLLSYLAASPISASTSPRLHWIVWSIVCLSLIIQTYGGRYIAILQGFEHMAKQRWIEAATGIASNFSAGLLLWFQSTLLSATIATTIVGALSTVAYRFAARAIEREQYHGNTPGTSTSSELKSAHRQIWSAAWRSGTGILCSTGLIQLLSMAVSNIAPATQAASFMFATRIAQVISALSQSPFYNHLPTLARKFREHKIGEIHRDARQRLLASSTIVACGFICAGFVVPYFLLYTHSDTKFVSDKIWIAMSFGYLVERVGAMHMQLYTLGGNVIWHWANGLTGLFFLSGAVILMPMLGVIAIPFSMLGSYIAIYCYISLPRSYRLLGLKFTEFDAYCTLPAVIILAIYSSIKLKIYT